MRSTFGCWRSMSSAPMYTTHGRPSSAQAVAVATPCWPAPVSAMTRVLPRRRVSSAWPERVVDLVGAGVGEVLALQVQPQAGDARRLRPSPASRARLAGTARRGGRRGRAASGGRRMSRAARAAPPRNAGRGAGRRRRSRAGRARPSGSRARTGRRTRAPSPSGRRRRPRGGPRGPGVGRERRVGPVVAGGPGALDEERDAERVLARPPAGERAAPRCRTRRRRRRPARTQRRADVRRVQAAGEDDRHLARDGGRETLRARVPVPPGCGPPAVSSMIRAAPAAR